MSGIIGGAGSKSGVIGISQSLSQPSWCSNRHGESEMTSDGIVTWNHASPDHNIGGCMHTDDIFYCSLSGVYQVYVGNMGNSGNSTDQAFRLKIDGSYRTGSGDYQSYRSGGGDSPMHHQFACFSQCLRLNGGQTIAIHNAGGGTVQAGGYCIGYIHLLA